MNELSVKILGLLVERGESTCAELVAGVDRTVDKQLASHALWALHDKGRVSVRVDDGEPPRFRYRVTRAGRTVVRNVATTEREVGGS